MKIHKWASNNHHFSGKLMPIHLAWEKWLLTWVNQIQHFIINLSLLGLIWGVKPSNMKWVIFNHCSTISILIVISAHSFSGQVARNEPEAWISLDDHFEYFGCFMGAFYSCLMGLRPLKSNSFLKRGFKASCHEVKSLSIKVLLFFPLARGALSLLVVS